MATRATYKSQSETNRPNATNHMDSTTERRLLRREWQRSTRSYVVCHDGPYQKHSIPCHFQHFLSVSSSRQLKDTTSVTRAINQSLEHKRSYAVQSYPAQPTCQKALTLSKKKEKSPDSLKSTNTSCNVPMRWSRMHKGIKRRKVVNLISRKHKDRNKHAKFINADFLQGRVFSFEETSGDEVEHMSKEACDLSFKSAFHGKGKTILNSGLNQKYQPKVFQDIAGHDIMIKAISKAVQNKKIAPLYLFYGPTGTGKTSAARIFAMGLNCESVQQIKPCWSCSGCTRSLYIMELCSGSRMDRFERIKTLIHDTSFTQALPGLKVLIIEEFHLFTTEAWDELLAIVEGPYASMVVIILVTIDVNNVPKNISSRCQKFCFSKLKDKDITLKLTKIIANENIVIEREALNMIITKSEGSLREAENILDQLALLGSRISSSMVQQFVGLVPQNKLINLLSTAVSGDTIKTVRFTKELIAAGVEPQALVSQLASLLTDVLSGNIVSNDSSSAGSSRDKRVLRSRSEFTNTQSHRLCNALKILVETEKQIRFSTDQTTDMFAALLQITSEEVCRRSSSAKEQISKPGDIQLRLFCGSSSTGHDSITKATDHFNMDRIEPNPIVGGNNMETSREKNNEKELKRTHIGDVENLWQDVLDRVQSKHMKEFLCNQVKIASLSVSKVNAIVHLMFKNLEDKKAAQIVEESISKALENAIGCPVAVNMSLEPVALGIIEEFTNHHVISDQQQRMSFLQDTKTCRITAQEASPLSESLRLMNLEKSTSSERQYRSIIEGNMTAAVQSYQTIPLTEPWNHKNQADINAHAERDNLSKERPWLDTAPSKPRNRWLSPSSIPQSDASVERYSQDILFDKANTKGESKTRKKQKFPKGFSETKDHRFQGSTVHTQLNQSWMCTDILCLKNTKG